MRTLLRWVVGLYLLAGGIVALGMMAYAAAVSHVRVSGGEAAFGLGYLIGAAAGFGLLRDRPLAWVAAVVILILQSPAFSLAGSDWARQYWFAGGTWVVVAAPIEGEAPLVPLAGAGMSFQYSVDRWWRIPTPDAVVTRPKWFGVNLGALAALGGLAAIGMSRRKES